MCRLHIDIFIKCDKKMNKGVRVDICKNVKINLFNNKDENVNPFK